MRKEGGNEGHGERRGRGTERGGDNRGREKGKEVGRQELSRTESCPRSLQGVKVEVTGTEHCCIHCLVASSRSMTAVPFRRGTEWDPEVRA